MTMITESRADMRPLAPIGLLTSIVNRIAAAIGNRRAVRDLAGLDEHILRDIGLSRADILEISAADFGADRMAMLDRARRRRLS